MKKYILFAFFLLGVLYGQVLHAQAPIRAFFLYDDYLFWDNYYYSGIGIRVIAYGGSEKFSFKWRTNPDIRYVQGANYYYPIGSSIPEEFDLFCTVIDTIAKDSIVLHKHLKRERLPLLYVSPDTSDGNFDFRNQYHVFQGIEDTISLSNPFYNLNDQDFTIEAGGAGAAFISRISIPGSDNKKVFYKTNFPDPGKFSLHFTLKSAFKTEQSEQFVNVIVHDKSNHGFIITKSIYTVNNYLSTAIIEIDEKKLWGATIEWTSDDPSFTPFTEVGVNQGSNELPIRRYISGVFYKLEHVGTFTLNAKVKLKDNSVYNLSTTYSVYPVSTISVSEVSGCKGDTVSIPIVWKNLPDESNEESFYGNLKFDYRKIAPVGFRKSGTSYIYAQYVNSLPDSTIRFFINSWAADSKFNTGDTLIILDFLIVQNDTVSVNVVNTDQVKAIPGGVNAINYAEFSHSDVAGNVTVFKFFPSEIRKNLSYTWTYGFDGKGISIETSPFIPHSDPGGKQNICLEVHGVEDGCLKTCDMFKGYSGIMYSISGRLTDTFKKGLAGEVYAYMKKDGKYLPSAKGVSQNGEFAVGPLEPGQYMLLGVPADTLRNAAWYFGEGIRVQGDVISVQGNVTDVDLVLSEKVRKENGTVAGVFQKDTTGNYFEKAFETVAGKLPAVAFLTDDEGEIVDWTYLSADNTYTLKNFTGKTYLKASFATTSDEQVQVHTITRRVDDAGDHYKIFPNPFDDALVIEQQEEAEMELVSITGQLVFSANLHTGRNVIDTGELMQGHYLVKLKSNNSVECFHLSKK